MLDQYIKLLKSGAVVAFPTETVYGLGADAWNPDAVKKVFKIKGRPADNPLIVHIANVSSVKKFASEIPEDASKLIQQFWPGPLTLIFKKKPEVLDIITAGLDTVALRWPRHPLAQELIAESGPLVAPSANSSGKPSPTKPKHVKEDFGNDFPVIEAGETNIGLESTVLDITQRPYQIYRPGAISAKQIEDVVNCKVEIAKSAPESSTAKSPGTKYSHYSPHASVHWLPEQRVDNDHALLLLHSKQPSAKSSHIIFYDQDFDQLAHELYDRFRQADHVGLNTIFVEPFTNDQLEQPLVQALQNRITKAID